MPENMTNTYAFPEVCVQLAERVVLYSNEPVDTPKKACDLMSDVLSKCDREHVCVVNLNAQNVPINYHIVSIGGLSSALAPMNNIFKAAILSNASSLVLLHNHPSGSLEPSREDLSMTRNVEEAAKLMDIRLLDHIIVAGGTGKCYSFLDHGLIADGMSKTSVFGESNTSYRPDRNNQMQELTKKLEDGIRELQSSDKYKHYLNVMGRFHHYSVNNCLLIAMQRPDAVQVAGYAAWEKNFQRHVKRGEKGIRIIAPAPYTVPKERVKCDPVTRKPILDKHGNAETEIVDVLVENYKAATVFDVSQTEGKELPEITYELNSNVGNYEELISAIRKISPVPIEFLDMPSSACKGYYNQFDKNIVVRLGMGESQTIKTMLHELSHAMLHDKDIGSQKEQPSDRRTKEVEAESVAYVVCQHYGIDTSDYSFGYVSGWCANSELSELKESLNIIQKTAANIIDGIQDQLREQEQKKSETLDQCSSISHDAAAPPTNEQHIRCRVRR